MKLRDSDLVERSFGDVDRPRYERFVDTSPQRSIYARSWWLDAVAPKEFTILTVTKGDEIRAAWPILLPTGGNQSRMPPLTQTLGILLPPSHAKYAERLSNEHTLINELLEMLPSGIQISQCFHTSFSNWLPFYWRGFQQTTRYTYLLKDLTDTTALWNGMRESQRRAIRKARREAVYVRETTDVGEFYEINQRTFLRQKKEIPYSLDLVSRLDAAAQQHAGRRILIADDRNGKSFACDYMVYDQDCAISIMSGADDSARRVNAHALLEWESIEFASGVSKKFDFEGSMLTGVERFVRGFGAVQTPYFCIWGNENNEPDESLRGALSRLLVRAAKRIKL